MWRTGSAIVQLSFPPSPIKSTIAARLFRSIAFLLLGVGSAALSANAATPGPQQPPVLAGSPVPATTPPPPPAPPSWPPPPAAVSVVYRASNRAAIHDYRTNPDLVRQMVNQLVCAGTRQSDVVAAWRSLISPNDKVGIKISAAGGELFTTHRDIVNTIVSGLVAAGHSRASIIVWDRALGGINEAGYRPDGEGYQIKSIAPHEGYDPKIVFTAPITGKLVWGDF